MKAIMMSIRPQYVTKILNGEKTVEIRKKFSKDYVGWVYIYVTKALPLIRYVEDGKRYMFLSCSTDTIKNERESGRYINGKVVARFWCDKVEEINNRYCKGMLIDSCLTNHELNDYLGNYQGYTIHITKLEIFDKPKEINEFMKASCKGCPFENTQTCHNDTTGKYCKLTHTPQSWCYIELCG